jgi:hypothetical protein
MIPAGVVFIYVAWSLASRRASFSGLFWFAAVALPLLAGVFPMLVLAASQHKSDTLPGLPGGGMGWPGKPPVVWGVGLFYLAGMFLYGILVWKNPLEQIVSLAAALLAVGLAFFAWRQGAFSPRLTINLRLDKTSGEKLSFSVNAGGQPLPVQAAALYRFQAEEQVISATEGQVEHFTELRRISFSLAGVPARPARRPGEIKVWTQQPMPDGSTGALPAWLIIGEQEWDLNKSGGEVVVPLGAEIEVVTVLFQ